MTKNLLLQYDRLLKRLLDMTENPNNHRPDRTGVGTVSRFGELLTIDLNVLKNEEDGCYFPFPVKRKLWFKAVAGELKTFLEGGDTVEAFEKNGCKFWSPWGKREHLDKSPFTKDYPEGYLGPIYGVQWASFDQPSEPRSTYLAEAVAAEMGMEDNIEKVRAALEAAQEAPPNQLLRITRSLCTNPFSRRHVVTAWNPKYEKYQALPPCHMLFQFWFNADATELSLSMTQRSGDVFVGVPHNIASYSLLLHLMCNEINKFREKNEDTSRVRPGHLKVLINDAHLYLNHIPMVKEYLSRGDKEFPTLDMSPKVSTYSWNKTEEASLKGYDPYPAIRTPVAV